MSAYLVWCPMWHDGTWRGGDDGESHASTVVADDFHDAAEQYAEKHFDEPFEEQTFNVKRIDGVVKTVRVVVDYDPVFTAYEDDDIEGKETIQ